MMKNVAAIMSGLNTLAVFAIKGHQQTQSLHLEDEIVMSTVQSAGSLQPFLMIFLEFSFCKHTAINSVKKSF